MATIQKKTDRYSFNQLLTEVINWDTSNITISSSLQQNTSNTLLNYKIFNNGRFIISGYTEFNHGTGDITFKTSKLPFNISKVISLNCSRYDSNSQRQFDFSICYNRQTNAVYFPIVATIADEWNALVWNIEGFI